MRTADLHGSTKNYIKNGGDFGKGEGKSYAGRNVLYGIREHVRVHSFRGARTDQQGAG